MKDAAVARMVVIRIIEVGGTYENVAGCERFENGIFGYLLFFLMKEASISSTLTRNESRSYIHSP